MSIVRGEVTEIKFELEQSRQENGDLSCQPKVLAMAV